MHVAIIPAKRTSAGDGKKCSVRIFRLINNVKTLPVRLIIVKEPLYESGATKPGMVY